MLKEILQHHIQIVKNVPAWQDAIRLAAVPLVENGFVEDRYINSMIHNVEENGPYIVIMPGLALPHAKPERGVIKTGVSLLKLEESVLFPEEKEACLLIVLAANDENMHLDLISELTDVLMEDDTLEHLLSAKSREDILACLS